MVAFSVVVHAQQLPHPTQLPAASVYLALNADAALVEAEIVIPATPTTGVIRIQRLTGPAPKPKDFAPWTAEPSQITAKQRSKRSPDAPIEHELFWPTITVYDNRFSFIEWSALDAKTGWTKYEAWSGTNFGSIQFCPELNVGHRQYLMLATVTTGDSSLIPKESLPAQNSFRISPGLIMTQGDPANASALEPVLALHELYAREGALIEAAAATHRTEKAAAAAEKAVHPVHPNTGIIKLWPVRISKAPTATQAPVTFPK